MAITLFPLNGSSRRQVTNVAVVISCVLLYLPTLPTALPMKDVIAKAMGMAEMEDRNHHHHHDHHHQHRQKREVTTTNCTPPANLVEMFEQLNSGLNRSQFLQTAFNNLSVSLPAGEKARIINGDPNEARTCPTSLTRDNSAPLSHRSLCPYFYDILQLPVGYFPSTLRWATCKCQQCVENSAYGCEAVAGQVAVLKPTGCFQGLQRYAEKLVLVNVACACAFKGAVVGSVPVESATPTPTTTTTTAASFGVN